MTELQTQTDPMPEETDNGPRPDDGPQDVGQEPVVDLSVESVGPPEGEEPEEEPTGGEAEGRIGNAPSVTAADVLAHARSELGTVEQPRNSNRTEYADEADHANGYAWCATFLVAMFRRAGMRLPSESAYTPTMAQGFRSIGRFHSSPRVGDVVFYHWPELGRIAHVGIVESIRPDGRIVAIEGNTDSAGGRTGGKVMRQVRKAHIAGYGRPRYARGSAGGGSTTSTTAAADTSGTGAAGTAGPQPPKVLKGPPAGLDVDGDLGPLTTKALQRLLGVPRTGRLDLRTTTAIERFLVARGFRKIKPGGKFGIPARNAFRRHLGLRPTPRGGFGPRFVKALQRRLNAGRL